MIPSSHIMCSHDPQTRKTPPNAADTPHGRLLSRLSCLSSNLSSPLSTDITAVQQRAAENALTVVHLCHAFFIPGQGVNTGIHLEFHTHTQTHTVLDLGEHDLGGFCYCYRKQMLWFRRWGGNDDCFYPPKAPPERTVLYLPEKTSLSKKIKSRRNEVEDWCSSCKNTTFIDVKWITQKRPQRWVSCWFRHTSFQLLCWK